MIRFNKKVNNKAKAQIKKEKALKNKKLNHLLQKTNNKNLTLSQIVLAELTVIVERKLNKVIRSKWRKNSKDIQLKPNNMNSITLMIRQAK